MPVAGKLVSRAAVAASASPGGPGRLCLLVDQLTGDRFLVDTGAAYSVIPFSSTTAPSGPGISTADGTPIPCWGPVTRVVASGGHNFQWSFLRAKVAFPILGADFLEHFDMWVDLKRRRLRRRGASPLNLVAAGQSFVSSGIVADSGKQVDLAQVPPAVPVAKSTCALQVDSPSGEAQEPPAVTAAQSTCALEQVDSSLGGGRLEQLCQQQFPGVFNPAKTLPPVVHSVEHHIETEGRPVAAKYRRLDPGKLLAAKKEFEEMERQGIVRRSKSSWASPLHMVKKSDGSWRPCGDFRRLNLQTLPDRYTSPNIADLAARLDGCKFFTKLDLRKGYHQVPVRPADIQKTAVITPFGLFEFLRMPFGLRNAGQSFQRFLDDVLQGLDFVFVYVDDILIASRSEEEHILHVQEVLRRLGEHGLVINAEKCSWGCKEVEYLGHQVAASGIRPLPSRVAAIKKFPQPDTAQQLMTYLGMVNFYRRFLRSAALILKPLTDVLKGGTSGRLTWTEEMSTAFNKSKEAMLNAAELAHPAAEAALYLEVDASGTHAGAVLHQGEGQSRRPLGFFSIKLEPAQQKYSAFDRELLACYLAVRHFKWILEGRVFTIFTDHKPLTFALHRLSDAWTARQQRHLSFIAEFTSDIRHLPGKLNVVADALSRPAASVTPAPDGSIDFVELAKQQAGCPSIQRLLARGSLKMQQVEIAGHSMWCDLSTGAVRPAVPEVCRRTVFNSVHGLAHPGIRATRRMLTSRFLWEGCAADVATWCRDCSGCARGKITRQEKTAVLPIPVPAVKFSHVHVDIVGPLPVSKEGHSHLLTIVDRSTRWPEVIPLKSITAEVCADTFVQEWVARFGTPHTITTDRGTQFTSSTWACMCKTIGAQHILTTAYHPQSNGMVERFHRQLKESLRSRGSGQGWLEHLPWVLVGLRAAPKEDSGQSSAEAVFGTALVLQGQPQQKPEKVSSGAPFLAGEKVDLPLRPRSYAEVAGGKKSWLEGASFVYIRRGAVGTPLAESYSRPYKVVKREDKILLLRIGDREEWVSADRLKPHLGPAPVAARPPRRGRPPGVGRQQVDPG